MKVPADMNEARAEALAILELGDDQISMLFFQKAMSRNLSRTVRHLDDLVENGGSDRELGEKALKRLGFSVEL